MGTETTPRCWWNGSQSVGSNRPPIGIWWVPLFTGSRKKNERFHQEGCRKKDLLQIVFTTAFAAIGTDAW